MSTHPLPESGSVTIGREDGCEILIDDSSVSRRHARVHLGPPLTIEDLGSANGTRVRDAGVSPEQPAAFAPGEVVELGSVMLIVQESGSSRRPHRIWSHGYFEVRMEDEAARAEQGGPAFAVARIHCDRPVPPGVVEETLAGVLRASDVLGTYGPGEHELLLCDTSPDVAEQRKAEISAELAKLGRFRVGMACHPRDGRNPHLLFAIACAAVRPPAARTAGVPEAPIVADPAMVSLYRIIDRIAPGSIAVLILGETGVGKEILAEAIHRRSPRSSRPFVRINCGAIPEALIESELFGHERGAFTHAATAKPGLFETADGGTVLLDEVGELPAAAQVKLLRVIEDKQVQRVGALKPRPVDVRFVAATHRDIEGAVERGTFRQDLYFRLNGMTLVVPPLRERPAEIERLARSFVERASAEAGRDVPALSTDVLALLTRYAWPGNIRELRNVMERAVLLCPGGTITLEQLPVDKLGARIASPPAISRPRAATNLAADDDAPVGDISEPERRRVLDALAQTAGNQTEAAKLLGVSRRTLSTWLDKLDIARPRKR